MALEGLNVGYRSLHLRNWMGNFAGNVYTFFTNSAEPANCCRPHTFCRKSLYASVTFTATAGPRTLAKENIWDVVWLSNASGSERRTRSTRFSRCLIRVQLNSLPLLISRVAILPRDYRLEALVSSQHPAFSGSFYLRGPPKFPHHL